MMAKNDQNTKHHHVLRGQVISDKMQKTIIVEVGTSTIHPRFGKVVRMKKKYKVHDEQEIAQVGDFVEIYEGRPMSKEKFMYLAHVVKSKKEQE